MHRQSAAARTKMSRRRQATPMKTKRTLTLETAYRFFLGLLWGPLLLQYSQSTGNCALPRGAKVRAVRGIAALCSLFHPGSDAFSVVCICLLAQGRLSLSRSSAIHAVCSSKRFPLCTHVRETNASAPSAECLMRRSSKRTCRSC